MNKFKIKLLKKTLILLLLFLNFLISFNVSAANISLESEKRSFYSGDEFEIAVFLDVDNEEVNAIDGSIIFPSESLELLNINESNSIISLWIEKPKLNDSSIIFSGIMPGGYSSNKGMLFSLVFLAKNNSQGKIDFKDIKILQNDGQATESLVNSSSFSFDILENKNQVEKKNIKISKIKDIIPPEDFSVEIIRNDVLYKGSPFLVFSTHDKQSGINYYEVKEVRNKKISWSHWKKAESPYLLKDARLKSFIYIKAVDNEGNEKIVELKPSNNCRWYEIYEIWAIILLSLFIYLFIVFYVYIKKRK